MTRVTLTALAVLSLVTLMGTAYAIPVGSSGNTAEIRLIDGEYFVVGQVNTDVRTTVVVEVYGTIYNNIITTLTLQTTSDGDFTTSLKSITDEQDEQSSWVISVFNSTSSGMEIFETLHLSIERTIVDKEPIIGDGTELVHIYEYPFNVTVIEGGMIVIHNESHRDYAIEHTSTSGTEKGGTFEAFVPESQNYALSFPIVDCSSCYPAGTYYFEDGKTGETGSITIIHPEGWVPPVIEEVGIMETVVVVLNREEPTITTSNSTSIEIEETLDIDTTVNTTPTEIPSGINNVPTFEGTYDIIKLQQQLASITSDYTNALETIGSLKSDVNSKNSVISELTITNGDLSKQVVILNNDFDQKIIYLNTTLTNTENNLQIANDKLANQQVDQTEVAELEKKVNSLSGTISTLEQQNADITKERDSWKQLADNWYGVALEQLRVMTNVLGL